MNMKFMKKNIVMSLLILISLIMLFSADVFSQDAAAIYREGLDALRSNNFDTAIAKFRDVLTIDPNFYFAYLNLGIAYRRQGKLQEAVPALEEAGKIAERDERFFGQYAHNLELAIIYSQTQKTDLAVNEYKSAIEKLKSGLDERNKPRYARALVSLGEIYYYTKRDYNSAYTLLAGPYKAGIRELDLDVLLAKSATRLNKGSEAINYFKNSNIMTIKELEDKDFYTLVEFWTLAIAERDADLALSISKKLIDTQKPAKFNAEAYVLHARSYIFAGNNRPAIEELKKAISAKYEKLDEAYKLKGIAYFNLDDLANAERTLKMSIEKDRSDSEAFYYLGLTLNKQEKRLEAKEAYETALKLEPSYKAAQEALAIVQQQIEQDEAKAAEEEEFRRLEEEEQRKREEAEAQRGIIR